MSWDILWCNLLVDGGEVFHRDGLVGLHFFQYVSIAASTVGEGGIWVDVGLCPEHLPL